MSNFKLSYVCSASAKCLSLMRSTFAISTSFCENLLMIVKLSHLPQESTSGRLKPSLNSRNIFLKVLYDNGKLSSCGETPFVLRKSRNS